MKIPKLTPKCTKISELSHKESKNFSHTLHGCQIDKLSRKHWKSTRTYVNFFSPLHFMSDQLALTQVLQPIELAFSSHILIIYYVHWEYVNTTSTQICTLHYKKHRLPYMLQRYILTFRSYTQPFLYIPTCLTQTQNDTKLIKATFIFKTSISVWQPEQI